MDIDTALQEVLKTALVHEGLAQGIREAAKVYDNKKLGGWVVIAKVAEKGNPRKVVGCSGVVVKDYGKESWAKDVIDKYFRCKK
ncbi:small ribosomal subunit protein eS12-like [Loxodonta africana]|uniref:small ribosomal subunit protein eS12-like n=2 Tax=Elephantidae TaxID=9780 RepID=UPI0030D2EFB5